MNIRIALNWTGLAMLGVFFFYATGGKTQLLENDKLEYISLFLPHMIFGSWAVLSTYYNLISLDLAAGFILIVLIGILAFANGYVGLKTPVL